MIEYDHTVALIEQGFPRLQADCQECGDRAYYRIGTAEWEHADA